MNLMPAFTRNPVITGIAFLVWMSCLPATGIARSTTDGQAVKARDVLPQEFFRSVHYEIAEEVTRSRFFYHFRVTSDFGTFEIASLPMLRVRLQEIITLAEVGPTLNKSSGSLDRSPPGRRGVGGDSVFIEPGRDEPATAPATAEGFVVDPGPHKRAAAAQLDVDVYSSNAALQALLDALAQARSAGKLRGPIAPAQPLRIGPIVFGSGVFDERLRSILKNKSAAEINANVDQRLATAGVTETQRTAFLANHNFTPRTRLYFTRYLGQLKQARGIEHIVRSANSASTEADARAFVSLARMIAFYQLTGSHLDRIIAHHNYPVMLTAAGVLVVALPVDHFSWTNGNAALITSLERFVAAEGAVSATILVAGDASPEASTELAAHGIVLRERYSF
jgi:hypothetical protein